MFTIFEVISKQNKCLVKYKLLHIILSDQIKHLPLHTNLPYFYQKVIFDFCLGLLGLYNNEMNSSPILGKGERTYVSVHKVECDKIEDRCSQTNIGNRG